MHTRTIGTLTKGGLTMRLLGNIQVWHENGVDVDMWTPVPQEGVKQGDRIGGRGRNALIPMKALAVGQRLRVVATCEAQHVKAVLMRAQLTAGDSSRRQGINVQTDMLENAGVKFLQITRI